VEKVRAVSSFLQEESRPTNAEPDVARLLSVSSRRVISRTGGGRRGSEWELCRPATVLATQLPRAHEHTLVYVGSSQRLDGI